MKDKRTDDCSQRQSTRRTVSGQFETVLDPLALDHFEQLRKASLINPVAAATAGGKDKSGSERRGKNHWFTNR